MSMDPAAALDKLRAGNARFLAGERNGHAPDFDQMKAGQAPFAAVLGCADSRVPAEIIFNQSFGDIFTVRVAGNVATATQIGSLDFAVEQLGCCLIVILGHSQCGAVKACLGANEKPSTEAGEPHINHVLEAILPGIAGTGDIESAVTANVHFQVKTLLEESTVIAKRVAEGKILVVGAEFDLATGEVTFFI